MSAIVAHRLVKGYPPIQGFRSLLAAPFTRERVPVLRDVSLQVAPGEVLGLIGPNGAGKSTLVEILATLLLPDGGAASVLGHDVVDDAPRLRQLIGHAPSSTGTFYGRLTGDANLRFFGLLHDVPPRRLERRLDELFELVALAPEARHDRFQRYSTGMKAWLSLARALLADPPVLLLDEPTRSLDPLAQAVLRRFLREELAGRLGKTILLVTHSLDEAAAVCDRVVILHEGRIVHEGPPGAAGGTELADRLARVTAEAEDA